MDAEEIIKTIRKRREGYFDSQIMGTAEDPKVYSAADLARAISDEYDSLLSEIESGG